MIKKARRILVFNVNWLGDALFSTATIRNIRYNFPESFIACVIPSRCYPVLKDNPHLDEIIIFDDRDRHRGILEKLKFVKALKGKNFDAVFLLHRSSTRALICRLAGIPQRIGYDTKRRGFLLTQKIPLPPKDSLHRIDTYMNIIEQAGLRVEDRYLEFYFSEEDEHAAEEFLKKHRLEEGQFLVGINPGGNWKPKRWPKEYWAALADRLIKESGAQVIITGSLEDITLADQLKGLMKEEPVIACGALNLKAFAALCKKFDLFITADTGPLHIANAVGAKKIIAFFGPTHQSVTGPYPERNIIILQKDTGCKIPCYEVRCQDNRCMKAITPDEVMEQVKS